MKLFLDTSVLLAACGSARGSSRALFDYAPLNGWNLMASPWVVTEVIRNLPKFPPDATREWLRLRPQLTLVDDVVRPRPYGRLPGQQGPPGVADGTGVVTSLADAGPR